MCCNERNPPAQTLNPAFELSYWRFGLRIAQEWRERLGMAREPYWDEVLDGLAPLPVEDGVYVLYEGVTDMWTEYNTNHPDPVAPFGMLPGDGVDVETMRATTQKVRETWPVADLYSWDFPLLAMNAARLGDPDSAVEYLLHERFGFTGTGLPASGKSGVPSPYFPAAGGLLYAVAMMCAGWRDSPGGPAGERGVPARGAWPRDSRTRVGRSVGRASRPLCDRRQNRPSPTSVAATGRTRRLRCLRRRDELHAWAADPDDTSAAVATEVSA